MEKADKSKVRLIAVDDDIKGPNNSPVPYIGMNAGAAAGQTVWVQLQGPHTCYYVNEELQA